MEIPAIKNILRCNNTKYCWESLKNGPIDHMRKAVVLVPLVLLDKEVHLWLTRRSDKVSHDKGHVAFPGGMKDPEDTSEAETGLREANEEIGLRRDQVTIIAQQIPRVNRRGNLITPVIGIVSPDFVPSPNEEVDLAFRLPLRRFLTKTGHSDMPFQIRGFDMLVHFFNDRIGEEEVQTWGLTAQICIELAILGYKEKPDFTYETKSITFPIDNPFHHQEEYMKMFIEQGAYKKNIDGITDERASKL